MQAAENDRLEVDDTRTGRRVVPAAHAKILSLQADQSFGADWPRTRCQRLIVSLHSTTKHVFPPSTYIQYSTQYAMVMYSQLDESRLSKDQGLFSNDYAILQDKWKAEPLQLIHNIDIPPFTIYNSFSNNSASSACSARQCLSFLCPQGSHRKNHKTPSPCSSTTSRRRLSKLVSNSLLQAHIPRHLRLQSCLSGSGNCPCRTSMAPCT